MRAIAWAVLVLAGCGEMTTPDMPTLDLGHSADVATGDMRDPGKPPGSACQAPGECAGECEAGKCCESYVQWGCTYTDCGDGMTVICAWPTNCSGNSNGPCAGDPCVADSDCVPPHTCVAGVCRQPAAPDLGGD